MTATDQDTTEADDAELARILDNPSGVGRPRGGASDTTMFMWLVIEANPGITRDELWAKVETQIPAGYAKRRLLRSVKSGWVHGPAHPDRVISAGRWYVFRVTLDQMRLSGLIVRNGDCLTVGRRPTYYGNAAALDITNTKAGEHLNRAYARRRLYEAADRLRRQPYGKLNPAEMRAFLLYFSRTGGDA